MRIPLATLATLATIATTVGCGSSADPGEPLLSSTLHGIYADQPFTPVNGFATIYQGNGLIGLGDGPIHCGTETASDPPSGTNAVFAVPLVVGSQGSVLVQLLQNHGSFESHGANTGLVTISAVSPDAVAGTISFTFVDTATDLTYQIDGDFEVFHCAP